jgi:multiple sugar transport system substrate-binding protein
MERHRRTSRRVATAAGLSLALAATLASAGAARPSSPAAAKATTVVLSGWTSSGVERTALDKTIAAFEASHPNVKVDYQPINGDYPAAMLAKFAARKPPDVFYVDASVAPDWMKLGALEPLDSYIKRSKFNTKKFFPRLLTAFKYKGHLYGFPKDWSSLAMETNNAIFKKYKLKVPKTWAQLRYVATRLRARGPLPNNAQPLCLDPDWARLTAFVYQNNGALLNAAKTRATVRTKAVDAAVKYYLGFVNKGQAAPHDKLGSTWCGEAFGKGRAAIIFEGPWVVPYMTQNFPKVGYTISPMPKGKTRASLAFTVSDSIARDSQNKDAAWTLLSWLTGKSGMRTWTAQGIALPSRSDTAIPTGKGNKVFVGQATYSRPWSFVPGWSTVYNSANNELQAVFQHKESVGAMLRKFQSALAKALASG